LERGLNADCDEQFHAVVFLVYGRNRLRLNASRMRDRRTPLE